MEYLFIYLLQIVELISIIVKVLIVFAIFGIILSFVLLLCYNENIKSANFEYTFESTAKEYLASCKFIRKLMFKIKKVTFAFLISILVLSLIPTKQTLLLLGGTYLGKKAVTTVVTNEKIKKVDAIINLQLDKYLQELKRNNKESSK